MLSPEPLLILDLPQSSDARNVCNRSDSSSDHNINHLIIGNLGKKEIVLCACDDGDVLAYYTERVDYSIQFSKFPPPNYTNLKIKPFFHENVGDSAWGLAIHQKSRLIAVSSNLHEVQVFVFALSVVFRGGICVGGYPGHSNEQFREFTKKSPVPRSEATGKILRAVNFRLKLPLTDIGDNIPSISFASDQDGEAFSVVASDIRGALWFLGIWDRTLKRLPMVLSSVNVRRQPMGWGVLVLPPEFFKPARTMFEAYGCPEIVANRTVAFDISPTTSTIRDNIIWHRSPVNADFEADMILVAEDPLNDDEDSDVDEEDDILRNGSEDDANESEVLSVTTNESSSLMARNAGSDISRQIAHEVASEIRAAFLSNEHDNPLLAYFRNTSVAHYLNYPLSASCMELTGGTIKCELDDSRSIDHLVPDGSLIFHANRHDVALIPSEPRYRLYTHCTRLLQQDIPHDTFFPHDITHYNRLNMLLTIPELSLVLVASQVGRVALITVTRAVYHSRETPWGTPSMRVDTILPFASQDSVKGFRPSTGLLGMGVSPMPRSESAKGRELGRWRLMLHYYDLTILSYVISNENELRVESV